MTGKIPNSRSYIHNKCGEVTEVDGGDFKNMASPIPGMNWTMCAACCGYYPVSEFKWADSNEEILAYYARHRARVSAFTSLICSRPFSIVIILFAFLAGIGIGIWSGFALGLVWGILIGLVASFVGVIATILIWDSIETRLLNHALGVPDVRCLE